MRIDELRSTLDQYADHGVPAHDDTASRVRSVHGRIAQARRRRTATGAGVLAVALVAAVGVVVAPDLVHRSTPQPADTARPARLAGWKIPAEQTVEGFGYRYVHGVETSRRTLRLELPSGDKQQTLAWASNSKDLRAFVTLTVDGEKVSRSTAGGLESGQVLYPGDKHTVVLSIDKAVPGDRLGLAVYDRSTTPPAGVTNGVSTFRDRVADDTLLGARFGRPGQREISFDVVLPSTRLRFSDLCSGAAKRAVEATTTIDGHQITGVPCGGAPEPDPGAGGATFADGTLESWGLRAGDTVHLRMRLTHKMGDAHTVEAPSAVMGFGVYAVAPPAATVAGWAVPRLSEGNGSTWSYASSAVSSPGDRRLVLRLPASDRDRQVTEALGDVDNGAVRMFVDGVDVGEHVVATGAGGGSFGSETVLLAGEPHTVELRLTRGGGPRVVLGLVVATRVR